MVFYKTHQEQHCNLNHNQQLPKVGDIYLPTDFTWQELAENLNRIDWKEMVRAEEAAMQTQTVKIQDEPEAELNCVSHEALHAHCTMA